MQPGSKWNWITGGCTLAWKIPWTEKPGRMQSKGSRRVWHDWATSLSLFTFIHLEEEMATHSSVLAWRIPGMGEPGGLPSMGSHRVGHNWSDSAAADGKESAYYVGDLGLIPELGRSLEKEMANYSSILAWEIPWTEEPGGLQSMGSQRVRHDWATNTHAQVLISE